MTDPGNEIRIRRLDWLAMRSHAESKATEEICGFVAGVRNRSTAVYPVENIAHRPDLFQMEGRSQLDALMAIDNSGWEILAIYHSHPSGSPKPSQLDYAGHYPDCALLIWTPGLGGWSCQAYRLNEQEKFVEISLILLLK